MKVSNVVCPYCGRKAVYMDSKRIYGNGRSYGMVYACLPCGAWVGVHKGTNRPLGRLADAELRQWKQLAHQAFDPLWKTRKMSRAKAYEWLSREMKIPQTETHIGLFDIAQCKQTIRICNKERNITTMANSTQVTTGKVRFSFVNVFTPKQDDQGKDKYSVTLLIPKSDKATLQKIKAAQKAAQAAYTEKNNKPAPTKITVHDGDGTRPSDGQPYGPECAGCLVMTVSSNNKPVIIDASKLPITDPQELYSGCYGRAIINFYCYAAKGNSGVSAGLNGLMKLHDGEPLAGGIVTDEDWDDGWEDPDGDDVNDLLG